MYQYEFYVDKMANEEDADEIRLKLGQNILIHKVLIDLDTKKVLVQTEVRCFHLQVREDLTEWSKARKNAKIEFLSVATLKREFVPALISDCTKRDYCQY